MRAPGTRAMTAHFRGAGLRGSLRAHWFARLIRPTDVSRRYFPSCASSASSSACGARFSARDPRPCTGGHRVTGPPAPPASCRTRTDRQAPLMRFRLFPSTFAGRAVPPRVTSSGPSRFGVVPTSAPTPGSRLAHAVFCASRLRVAFQLRVLETPPARVIRGRFLSTDVPDPRPDCSRDLAGIVKVPATPMGFTYCPSQFCFRPRVTASFDVSDPHAVSTLATARFIVAGSAACDDATEGLWLRLLGFGPASEPCRAICRPRYSFYA